MDTGKRPTTGQLKRVISWLEDEVGLSLYGPVIDKQGNEWDDSGFQDYRLQDVLLRWQAIKRERKVKDNGPT